MNQPKIAALDIEKMKSWEGVICAAIDHDGVTAPLAPLVEAEIARLTKSDAFKKAKAGDRFEIAYPRELAAKAVSLAFVPKDASDQKRRKAGAALAKAAASEDMLALSDDAELVYGIALRDYAFTTHKSDAKPLKDRLVMADDSAALETALAPLFAIASGVHFTRDLTNEPANILSTSEFASRLKALETHGLKVEIVDAKEMKKLGMNAFLAVGLGSVTPTQMVVMHWNGGGKEKPFALVGKGVVFDTGGISLKPANGMEDMTMDMGGAGVVAGVMKSLALRKAKCNVVGVVGLVENMPDAAAQRPGDVVTSMKGDTIEVINTDAEGRLVLCDALWYTQKHLKPRGIIDLATLTGAAIIALGHEKAAVFGNNDSLVSDFLKAADSEEEGAWHMPLAKAYDDQLKSRIADMKNTGGRPAGSITAAQFLKRFVEDDMPWIHLDIAGVASTTKATTFAPSGASGWGVRSINRYLADHCEE